MADYYNSIITKYNTDNNGNIVPKLIQNENIKVLFNGIALLDEFPYKPYGVFINGYTEVSSGTLLTSTQFYVEYDGAGSCKIHFAISEVGKHLQVTYKGIGKECIIAARIATEYTEDGDIVQSLADYINQYIGVMDANRIHRQVVKYTATSPITIIPYASITGLTWNPAFDNLQIIRDNLILIEDENYSVDDNGITLYEALDTGESIFVIVFRGLLADVPAPSTDGSLILNGSIGKFKLEQSVQDKIDTVPTLQMQLVNHEYNYFMTSFNYYRMKLCLLASVDGEKFDTLEDVFVPSLGNKTLRDPSMVKVGDYFYITYTVIDWLTGSTIGMCKTKDFVDFEELPQITIGTFNKIWAPSFYVENGNVYIIINTSSDGVNFLTYIVQYNTSTNLISNLTQITGTNLPSNIIDAHIYKFDGLYYLVYKNETTKYIEIATSSYLTSGYVVVKNGDWTGWGFGLEGCSLIKKSDGTYRIYFENYTTHDIYYSESSSILGTWSTKTLIRYSTDDSFAHPEIHSFDEIFINSHRFISNMESEKYKTIQLTAGITTSLKAEPNSLYYVADYNSAIIQDIDITDLKINDKIHFVVYSSATDSYIKISPTDNFLVPCDFNIGSIYGNTHEMIHTFKVVKDDKGFVKLRCISGYNFELYPSHMIIKRTSEQTIADSTLTKVAFDSIVSSQNIELIAGGDIKIKENGLFSVNLSLGFLYNTTGIRVINIVHNGNAIATINQDTLANFASGPNYAVSTIIKASKDDLICVKVLQTSGGNLNIANAMDSPVLSIAKL